MKKTLEKTKHIFMTLLVILCLSFLFQARAEAADIKFVHDPNQINAVSDVAVKPFLWGNMRWQINDSRLFFCEGSSAKWTYINAKGEQKGDNGTTGKNAYMTAGEKGIWFRPAANQVNALDPGNRSGNYTINNPFIIRINYAGELADGSNLDLIVTCSKMVYKLEKSSKKVTVKNRPSTVGGVNIEGASRLICNQTTALGYKAAANYTNGSKYLTTWGAKLTLNYRYVYHTSSSSITAGTTIPSNLKTYYFGKDYDVKDLISSSTSSYTGPYAEGLHFVSGQDASRTYNVTPPGQTFKLRSSGNRLYGSASNNETNQNTSWQAGFIVKGTGDTTWTWTGSGCGSTLGLMYSKGGALRIHKKSSDPALTRSNDDYSLSGATFALYSDSACTKKVYPAGSAVLATNEQSNIWAVSPATEGFVGTPTDIPAGTYYLKELTAPKGFSKINGEGRYGQITITASRYTDISVYDNPLRPKATYRSDKYGKVKDIKTDTMVQETSETVQLKKSPGGLDAPEEEPADGYHTVDPEAPWTADKAVTLKNGTVLAKGTPMTMEQIKNVVMTEDVVFSVLHSINENYQGPVKEYSGGKKKTSGEKYTYTITQKLNLHASNYPNKNYQSFEMTDTLPDELEYLSSAVYDKETGESLNSTYFIVTAAGQDITATAFKALPANGHTLEWKINVRVKNNLFDGDGEWANHSVTTFDNGKSTEHGHEGEAVMHKTLLSNEVINIAATPLPEPTKTVDNPTPMPNKPFTYVIEQPLQTAGIDGVPEHYTDFVITDRLDVTYATFERAALYEEDGTKISDANYDSENNTVTWTQDSASPLALDGRSVYLKIQMRVKSDASLGDTWDNIAETLINDQTVNTNVVTVTAGDSPYYAPVKSADKERVDAGESYTYIISQKIHEYDYDYDESSYQHFNLSDALPDEVEYESMTIADNQGHTGSAYTAADGTTITYDSDRSITATYDSDSHTIYLEGESIPLNGQTITVQAQVKAKETLDPSRTLAWDNKAMLEIDDHTGYNAIPSNIVTTYLNGNEAAPEKSAYYANEQTGEITDQAITVARQSEEYYYTITQRVPKRLNAQDYSPAEQVYIPEEAVPANDADFSLAWLDKMTITDKLPDEVEFVSASISDTSTGIDLDITDADTSDDGIIFASTNEGNIYEGGSYSLTYEEDTHTLSLEGENIPAFGQDVSINVKVKVNASLYDVGHWENTATTDFGHCKMTSNEVSVRAPDKYEAPEKETDKTQVKAGEEFTYTITQKINTAYKDYYGDFYGGLNLNDDIPTEVEIRSIEIYDDQGNLGTAYENSETRITYDNGAALIARKNGNNVCVSQLVREAQEEGEETVGIPLNGQIVTVKVSVVAKEDLTFADNSFWDNTTETTFVNTSFGETRVPSNTVRVSLEPDYPAPEKETSSEQVMVGDEYTYTITQRLHQTGADCSTQINAYDTFYIEDVLPKEVDYIDSTWEASQHDKLEAVYDAATHTARLQVVSGESLSTDGDLVTWSIRAKANRRARVSKTWDNTATTTFAFPGNDPVFKESDPVTVEIQEDGFVTILNQSHTVIDGDDIPSTEELIDLVDPLYYAPVKSASAKTVSYGEEYTYTIKQKLNTYNENYPEETYESFVFSDYLPLSCIAYQDISVKLYNKEGAYVRDIDGYGTIEEGSSLLDWTPADVTDIPLEGGHLEFILNVQTLNDTSSHSWDNVAQVAVDGTSLSSNEVTVALGYQDFAPEKEVDKELVKCGDEFVYTITQRIHKQTVDYDGETYATAFTITDDMSGFMQYADYISAKAFYSRPAGYLNDDDIREVEETEVAGASFANGTFTWTDATETNIWQDHIPLLGGQIRIEITMQVKDGSAAPAYGTSWNNTAIAHWDNIAKSSNTVTNTVTNNDYYNPQKSASINGGEESTGPGLMATASDTITYTITQKINKTGTDYDGSNYIKPLVIMDKLPKEVEFISARAIAIVGNEEKVCDATIEDEASTLSQDFEAGESDALDFGGFTLEDNTITWSDEKYFNTTDKLPFSYMYPYRIAKSESAARRMDLTASPDYIKLVLTLTPSEYFEESDLFTNTAETHVDGGKLLSNPVTIQVDHRYTIIAYGENVIFPWSEDAYATERTIEDILPGAGQNIPYQVDPNLDNPSKYRITYVEVDGEPVPVEDFLNGYFFQNIQSDHTLYVRAENTHKIIATGEHTTITPRPVEWSYFTPLEDIEDGGSRTIDYEPEEGYHIASITVDGVPVDINQYPTSYTFANITEDHTIHIVSAPNSVSVPITGMKGILLSLLAGVALLLMSLMAYEKRRARR